ncbi:hypothetical protein GCM10007205_03000 [Oxalicibacterium flavum]|uniref:EAL domain-containing protein n=1 Tax=Oxalicibacterium flavum TaxID=179467 RepID=A0A8J2UKQ0_9BURK|nr:EAL domain-containing protein [Oxalicibacterium flavum]GGB97124.1 hypothetical protein GCM10007205_03000 [Oxalicibacterium flavum]
MTALRHDADAACPPFASPTDEHLCIRLLNAQALRDAYGIEFDQAVAHAVHQRLQECGFPAHAIVLDGDHARVSLADLPDLTGLPRGACDQITESIVSVLCREAVTQGTQRAYLNANATFVREDKPASLPAWPGHSADNALSPGKVPALAHTGHRIAYRSDMVLAHDFLQDLRHGVLLLYFQPVTLFTNTDHHLYHEALLRRTPSMRSPYSCVDAIGALKRLGLIARLDRSVVWSTVELLELHPHMHLGCNVSALSLQDDAWWRLLHTRLAIDPDLSSRLTLEITEPDAVADIEQASALLARLRRLGCRIAIDDIDATHGSLEFMRRVQPDVVKIDRSVLLHASMPQQTPELLRKLTRLCADYCPAVIAEGIETLDELALAIRAGVHGVQGFLIAEPSMRPAWLNPAPARVEDAFWLGLVPCFQASPPCWMGGAPQDMPHLDTKPNPC